MLPICLIIALSLARSNPFSFGGARNARFDPMRPGIVGWMQHPLLLALTVWVAPHIVPNGDLPHRVLFGTFTGFAVLGRRLIDRRKQREMGTEWHLLRAALANEPLCPPSILAGAAQRLAASLTLYALLIWLHPVLFGVKPLW